MAKISMTGRSNTSYRTKYLDLKKKYEKLLELKINFNQNSDDKTDKKNNSLQNKEGNSDEKKENTDDKTTLNEPKKTLENKSSVIVDETKEKDEGSVPPIPSSNNSDEEEEEIRELDIEEEHQENPEDYDYICPDCKEMFMEDGNKNSEGEIVCPSCKEIF